MKLDCGIACRRIVSWLDDELHLACDGGIWTFAFDGGMCRITASPLPSRTLGMVSLERTLVTFEGDPPATDEFYRLFTLRFISAGG